MRITYEPCTYISKCTHGQQCFSEVIMTSPVLKVYKMPGLLSPLQIDVIIPKDAELSQNNLANKQPIGILKTLVAYTVKRFRETVLNSIK